MAGERRSRLAVVVAVALSLAACSGLPTSVRPTTAAPPTATSTASPGASSPSDADVPDPGVAELLGPFPVTRVVDGDTIWVEDAGERVRVRFIGIDTAETVAPGEPVGCFGPEATAEAERLMAGQQVYLEVDESQGRFDRFDRLLAYVWLTDGRMVNYELVRNGFAIEYTYDDPYRYQADFRAAQAAAESEQLGLWAPSTCDGVQ
jgi:micrococcal nuclease